MKSLKAGDRISFTHATYPFGPIFTTVLEIKEGGFDTHERPIKLKHDRFDSLCSKDQSVFVFETYVDGKSVKLPRLYDDGTLRLSRSLEAYKLDSSKKDLPSDFNQVHSNSSYFINHFSFRY